jgi:hypothetical protein
MCKENVTVIFDTTDYMSNLKIAAVMEDQVHKKLNKDST